jgi:hypothetical protein
MCLNDDFQQNKKNLVASKNNLLDDTPNSNDSLNKIQVEFEKGSFDYTSSPKSSVDMGRAFSEQQINPMIFLKSLVVRRMMKTLLKIIFRAGRMAITVFKSFL